MKEDEIPKYKCMSCGKPMHKPNKMCTACKKRKRLMRKANSRGQDKFSYVERRKVLRK